jgi:hypothetical protein
MPSKISCQRIFEIVENWSDNSWILLNDVSLFWQYHLIKNTCSFMVIKGGLLAKQFEFF